MICPPTAFNHSGCSIYVNLSFPTLDYCTINTPILGFNSLDIPALHVPEDIPSPDIGIADVACIDIVLTGSVTFAVPRKLALGFGQKASFGVASGLSGCASGIYRLHVGLEIPCILDGLPNRIPIKISGRQVGQIKFTRASFCSIVTVVADIGNDSLAQGLRALDVDTCALSDEIQGEVREVDSEGGIKFESQDCKLTKVILEVPRICLIPDDFVGNNLSVMDLGGRPNIDIRHERPIWDNAARFWIGNPARIIDIRSPDFDVMRMGTRYEFYISGYREEHYGPKGATGSSGDPGSVTFVVADIPGYTGKGGPQGVNGIKGDKGPSGCTNCETLNISGPKGPQHVCSNYVMTCPCPHSVAWPKFTGVLTINSCNIVGNSIEIAYQQAEYQIKQSGGSILVEILPKAIQKAILPGKEFILTCG